MQKANVELEARFLEIDVPSFKLRLKKLGAQNLGSDFFKEIIFYDKELTWSTQRKRVRMRQTKDKILVSFKHNPDYNTIETTEIEFESSNWDQTKLFLESIGLVAAREQEKKRHSYRLDRVLIDIDEWPKIPPYVEIEGTSEEAIRSTAEKLGFEWKNTEFRSAAYIIENYYHIPVTSLKYFTFDRVE